MTRLHFPFSALLALCLLVVFTEWLPTSAATPTQEPHFPAQGIATANANLRSGPSTTYDRVGSVQAGQNVQIVECGDGCTWYKLDNGNWIFAELVDLGSSTPGTNETSTSALASEAIAIDTVNLRSGPGTNYQIVGTVQKGEILSIVARNPDSTWYNLEGGEWIAAFLVDGPPDVLPVAPSAAPAPVPTATISKRPATPLSVEVLGVTPRPDDDGNLWLYGEVQNTGTLPAKDVKVVATLYGGNGKVLAAEDSYAIMPFSTNLWNTAVLYPSERAPFDVLIENPGDWKDWHIELQYEEAKRDDFAKHYSKLQVINDQIRYLGDFLCEYSVTGEIKNIGNSETGNVWVVATLYDSQGSVVDLGTELTEVDPLGPGKITPFEVCIYAIKGEVASYSLLVRSVKH